MYTIPVTGLAKFTEYEFLVLAFTSAGDGKNSSVQFAKTKEDSKLYCLNWLLKQQGSLKGKSAFHPFHFKVLQLYM